MVIGNRWRRHLEKRDRLRDEEGRLLRLALVASEWSLRGAATALDMSATTLQKRLALRFPELDAERRGRLCGKAA